jgi:cytochrome c oxidase subunit IV
MKKHFKYLRQDRLILRLFILSFVLLSLAFIYIIFSYSSLPPVLPIFNQLPWGESRLSITPGIFIPPIIALVFIILNMFFAAYSYEKSPLLARLFAVTTCLTGLITLLFVFRTITLIV